MSFKLPTAKVKEIKSKCKQALREKMLLICQLAHIILGVLSSTHLAILSAPLHYRGLQMQKIKGLLLHPSYKSMIVLEEQSVMDLNWWISNLETTNGRPIHLGVPEMMIESNHPIQAGEPVGRTRRWVVIGHSRNLNFISIRNIACCFSSPTYYHGE